MVSVFKISEDGKSIEGFQKINEKQIIRDAGVDTNKTVPEMTDDDKLEIYEKLKEQTGITPKLEVIEGKAPFDERISDFNNVKSDSSFEKVSQDVKDGKDVVVTVGGGLLSKFSLNGGNNEQDFLAFARGVDALKGEKEAQIYVVAYDMAAKPTLGLSEYNKAGANPETFFDKEVVAMTKGIFDPLLKNDDGSKRKIEDVKSDFQKLSFVGRAEASAVIDQMSMVLKERMLQLGYNKQEVAESVPEVAVINTAAVPSKDEVKEGGFTKVNSYATNNTFALANKTPFGQIELPKKAENTISVNDREIGLYTTMETDITSEKIVSNLGDISKKPIQKNAVETGSHPAFHTSDELGVWSKVLKELSSQVIGRGERLSPKDMLEKAGQILGGEDQDKIERAQRNPMVKLSGESVRSAEAIPYAVQVSNARQLNDKVIQKGGYEQFIADLQKERLRSPQIEAVPLSERVQSSFTRGF